MPKMPTKKQLNHAFAIIDHALDYLSTPERIDSEDNAKAILGKAWSELVRLEMHA